MLPLHLLRSVRDACVSMLIRGPVRNFARVTVATPIASFSRSPTSLISLSSDVFECPSTRKPFGKSSFLPSKQELSMLFSPEPGQLGALCQWPRCRPPRWKRQPFGRCRLKGRKSSSVSPLVTYQLTCAQSDSGSLSSRPWLLLPDTPL